MMDNGLKIKHTAEVVTCTWMGRNISESGKTINNMAKVLKRGLMVLCMKGILSKARKKGSGCLNGQIHLNTQEVF